MREWWSRRSRSQKLLIIAAGLVVMIAAAIDSANDSDPVAAESATTTEAPGEEIESPTTTQQSTTIERSTTTTEAQAEGSQDEYCVREGNSMRIDASCFPEDEWPLSAEQGTLICHEVDAVTFTGAGGVYAVNGMAMTRDLGDDIDPIWLDNPELDGLKINIGPLIDLGLTLCE